MTDKLMKAAKELNDDLWSIAARIGIDRTHENAKRFSNIFSGAMHEEAIEIGLHIDLPDDFADCIVDRKSASTDEKLLAGCFISTSLILDYDETGDSAWLLLCSCYRVVGMLEASRGIGSTGESIKGMYAKLGALGAQKRHAPMAALRSWAIERYQAGDWQSANQAAHSLKDSVIKHGRKINAHLSEENAQRTIAEWFRKSV